MTIKNVIIIFQSSEKKPNTYVVTYCKIVKLYSLFVFGNTILLNGELNRTFETDVAKSERTLTRIYRSKLTRTAIRYQNCSRIRKYHEDPTERRAHRPRRLVEPVRRVQVVRRQVVRGVRPARRGPGSLRRQAHRRTHGRLELGAARGRELLEGRRVTLREVQLRLDDGGRGRERARRFGGVRAPSLRGVRIHVVINVFLHFGFRGEPSAAVRHRAAERPVSLMCPRVLIQNSFLSEIFPALRALVRFLARVNAQMLVQNSPLTEKPRAVYTSVRFLVRMYT